MVKIGSIPLVRRIKLQEKPRVHRRPRDSFPNVYPSLIGSQEKRKCGILTYISLIYILSRMLSALSLILGYSRTFCFLHVRRHSKKKKSNVTRTVVFGELVSRREGGGFHPLVYCFVCKLRMLKFYTELEMGEIYHRKQ